MNKDKQSGFKGQNVTGNLPHTALGSTGDTGVNVEPHSDNEVEYGREIYKTLPSVQTPKADEPHSGTEALVEYSTCITEAKQENESSRRDNSYKTTKPYHDAEAGLEKKTHLDNDAHCDRGWAWVVCGTTFLMEFFVGGLITSSGVIYAALVDEFNKSRAETGENRFQSLGTYLN